jgi:hypothetical protein
VYVYYEHIEIARLQNAKEYIKRKAPQEKLAGLFSWGESFDAGYTSIFLPFNSLCLKVSKCDIRIMTQSTMKITAGKIGTLCKKLFEVLLVKSHFLYKRCSGSQHKKTINGKGTNISQGLD